MSKSVDRSSQRALSEESLMRIATLKKPYGIKGWLWVFSDMQQRDDIFAIAPWYMKTATGFKPLTVDEWRIQGSGLVASFKEIPDRTVAESMNGTTIWVAKDVLPPLVEGEYYWSDLIGLTVVNKRNECLGAIKNLFETGAHDIITVCPTKGSIDNEERLIPWHHTVVESVDLARGVMVVAWEKDY